MDVPVRPGDVLAQPTRARVFALLNALGRPAATEQLAAELGLHPNGVRLHLERLLQEGLVERRRERRGRGRPRDAWMISPRAQPGGDPPTAYAALSRWLIQALARKGANIDDMEETGRLIGRGLASARDASATTIPGATAPATAGGSDADHLFDTLSVLGFQPELLPSRRGRHDYQLCNCPYRQAVHERQPLVCALHHGLTQGLIEALDPESRVVLFEPGDPDLAGCLIGIATGMSPSSEP
jgi:predicted ArsR family transcriptional regulator